MPRDFLPLTVDYREYTYAAGRIPGGFFKREGRPTEKEIITSRLIDRPLRPLFPAGYTSETQIISFVLSADGEHDPDILAINGASAALVLSRHPVLPPGRRGARRPDRRRGGLQPDQQPARRRRPRPRRRRHRGGGGDGRGGRQPALRGGAPRLHLRRARRAAEGHPGAARDVPRERPREAGLDGAGGLSAGALRQVRAALWDPLEDRALHHGQVRAQGRRRRRRSRRICGALPPSDEPSRAAHSQEDHRDARGRDPAPTRCSTTAAASTAARSTRSARSTIEVGVAAAHPRLGALHPRRDAGAGVGHARHPARRPDHRGVRGRDARRSSCCTTTSRRSRSAR